MKFFIGLIIFSLSNLVIGSIEDYFPENRVTSSNYGNTGLLEIPFAVVNKIRLIVSLSYQKLLGSFLSHALYKSFGLPDIVTSTKPIADFSASARLLIPPATQKGMSKTPATLFTQLRSTVRPCGLAVIS